MQGGRMKVVFISSDYQEIVYISYKDYEGSRGFYQSLLDFKDNQCLPNSSDKAFLGDYGDWDVYFTNKELPNDLKYEGSIKLV
jgi:hypothetical protein